MSSSPQNGQPSKKKKLVPPATGWNCPMCGQKALIRVNKSCRLEDGMLSVYYPESKADCKVGVCFRCASEAQKTD